MLLIALKILLKRDSILKGIVSNASTIRYEMARRTKNQLRRMPELSFFVDDSLERELLSARVQYTLLVKHPRSISSLAQMASSEENRESLLDEIAQQALNMFVWETILERMMTLIENKEVTIPTTLNIEAPKAIETLINPSFVKKGMFSTSILYINTIQKNARIIVTST